MLVVICGATATGKSALALTLAQGFNSAILSADSRQVYQGFDIGTAKPSPAERQQVPHYLIDLCPPTQTLTLADYQAQAQQLIATLPRPADRPLFLVGGTGLYIKAIVKGLQIPRVAPQPALRASLQALGQGHCHQLLQQVDPVTAARVHPHDPARTLRALEVFYVTGRPLSQQQGARPPDYPILQLGLTGSPEVLAERIARRTAQMLAAGLAAEVAALGDHYGWDLPLLNTLGYREMKAYLTGQGSLADAEGAIALHTRQFAKQQRTWFRAVPEIEWWDLTTPGLDQALEARIQRFLSENAPRLPYR